MSEGCWSEEKAERERRSGEKKSVNQDNGAGEKGKEIRRRQSGRTEGTRRRRGTTNNGR